MSVVRYCLGCAHLGYNEGSSWQSEYSGGHDPSEFYCKKWHWKHVMGWSEQEAIPDLEAAFLTANTCPDFTPRTKEPS